MWFKDDCLASRRPSSSSASRGCGRVRGEGVNSYVPSGKEEVERKECHHGVL